MSDRSLKGKHIVIGGGAKHYNSDATRAAAEETVAAVEAAGAEAFAHQGDLTRPAEVAKLFDAAKAKFGKIDIAINTTGMVIKKPLVEVTEAEYDTMFAVNSKAAFFFIQEAGKKLADDGNICTIVSSLLAAYTPFYAVYPGSKAPIEHFTRAASKEFGERGISVNAVGPGPMDTPFFYPAESKESAAYHATAAALSNRTKSGLTEIQDIAPLVKFLVTDGWWITGQTIFANGGYTTR
jgi:NAD(P)-dependent dehydrogenase (short-subunit alcohol dehydrogenase family)